MKYLNVFKLNNGRIEYTDRIKEAVLNPRITGLKLHMDGGYDYIDTKYGFIKLLLSRGQVAEITTHQDLLGRTDYLEAMKLGVFYSRGLSVYFEAKPNKGRSSYASEKRVCIAQEKFTQFVNQQEGA